MKEMQTIFPHEFYSKHLVTLKKIHFTAREIDVMACIINARRASKIASFLSIGVRTVESHIHNIMHKIECNSQEGIIDFIESSDKLLFLKEYYILLRIKMIFEKSLTTISKINQKKGLFCLFIQKEEKDFLGSHLIYHLKYSGVRVTTDLRKNDKDYVICILPKTLTAKKASSLFKKIKKNTNKIFFLLQEKKHAQDFSQELINYDVIDFTKQEDYYFTFFNFLKKLLPHINFDKTISEFKDQYETLFIKPPLTNISLNKKTSKDFFCNRKRNYILLLFFIIGAVVSGFFAFRCYQKNNENLLFRSDLILPRSSVLLDRSEILKELGDKLEEKKEKETEIPTVALVGVGGAGKTTLARQYAHQNKRNSVWEINAETQESLYASFEKLAHALAKTERDQKALKEVQEIGNPSEKEKKIIQLVKEHLYSHPNWLLIYDNVITFTNIQKYFPRDSDTWGRGQIILTTRDGNIGNNEHVDHIIFVGELNSEQKLMLFTKIMIHDKTYYFTSKHNEETKNFLDKIPSFPLDVSIAAYYLKATNVPFSTYLENLSHFNKDFTHIQENILREVGEYSKVRYCIITSSLRKILEEYQEFEGLFLISFLLDSQNIPRDLLDNFKDDILVSNFIFNLKKYSLLTNEPSNSSVSTAISIHRSTQAIGLYYLQQKLELEKNKELIKFVSEKLLKYIEKIIGGEDVVKMKSLITHYEAFLKHKNLLTPDIEGIIKGQLGIIYYFLGDNLESKSYFEESILILNKFDEEHQTRIALFMGYLGNALRDLGEYEKAKTLIEKSTLIYEKYYPKDNLKHAYSLAYLGIIERYLGHYNAARNAFEKGMIIYKKHFPENENYKAWVSGQLAILDRELGKYEQAKDILETSLKIFEKDRSPDHFDLAWALEHLGVVYTNLNQYTKAQETLEKSLRIYAGLLPDQIGPSWILAVCDPLQSSKNYETIKVLFAQLLETYKVHFHDNYIYVAYPLSKLGSLYIELGNYKKAKLLLEQSLSIYQKNYGKYHLILAQILNDLGSIYLLEDKLNDSENLFRQALEIFQLNNHLDQYSCLERLSDLFLKKSLIELNKGKKDLSQNFRNQSISLLKNSLKIIRTQLGKDSPHIKRLEEKLKKLEN